MTRANLQNGVIGSVIDRQLYVNLVDLHIAHDAVVKRVHLRKIGRKVFIRL